jgi:hypothetical protein
MAARLGSAGEGAAARRALSSDKVVRPARRPRTPWESPAMKFMKANGLVLHFSDQGRRDGPPLVFINSLGTDFPIWNEVAEILASDFRIVVYDKRGHRLSEAGPDKNDTADDAGIFVYPDSRTPLCLALPVPVIRGYRHPPCFRAADSRRPRGPFSVCPNLF